VIPHKFSKPEVNSRNPNKHSLDGEHDFMSSRALSTTMVSAVKELDKEFNLYDYVLLK